MLLNRLENTIQVEYDQYSTDVNHFTAVKEELQNFKDVDNLDRYIDDIVRRTLPNLKKTAKSPDLNAQHSKKSLHEAPTKASYTIPKDKNFIRKNIEALKRNQELLRERQEAERLKSPPPKPAKSPSRPKLGGGLLDALKNRMKVDLQKKIEAAKNAWADLEKDIPSDGASNSQADLLDYSQSIKTPEDSRRGSKLDNDNLIFNKELTRGKSRPKIPIADMNVAEIKR